MFSTHVSRNTVRTMMPSHSMLVLIKPLKETIADDGIQQLTSPECSELCPTGFFEYAQFCFYGRALLFGELSSCG